MSERPPTWTTRLLSDLRRAFAVVEAAVEWRNARVARSDWQKANPDHEQIPVLGERVERAELALENALEAIEP